MEAGLEKTQSEKIGPDRGIQDALARIKTMVGACIQCGTCSASCPNAEFMDITPRQMWRMLLSDQTKDLFESHSFMMCSACYYCTLRCPRGLELTLAMAALKQVGARMNLGQMKSCTLFYSLFLDNVRQYGRVREMELMGRYFWGMKNPITPITYAPLGLRLLRKKKIKPQLPRMGKGKLSKIFDAVKELEQ